MSRCLLPALSLVSICLAGCHVVAVEDTFEMEGISSVVIQADNGDVLVVGEERDTVFVDLSYGGVTWDDVGAWDEDGVLYVDLACGDVSACGGDLRVAVPAELPVEVVLDTGNLSVLDLAGPLVAEVIAGDASGSGLRSPEVGLTTHFGNLDLGFTERPARVCGAVDAGDLTYRVPAGVYDVDLEVGAGSVSVSGIEDDPEADATLYARNAAGAVLLLGL